MSAYSETKFETQHYHDSRPQYSDEFYDELMKYHKGNRDIAIDLGCGTGFVTFKLTKYFNNVIGTDPSTSMIAQCNKSNKNTKVKFLIGTAESQPSEIEPNSIDLITAGESAHWFDHPRFFKECHRVLKSNSTLVYWLYKDPIFIGYPKANEIYTNYTYNSKIEDGYEKYMGPYYQQPGHDYLRTLMREIEPPNNLFTDVIRNEYLVDRDGIEGDKYTKLFIKKTIDMVWFLNYVKSWSAYHSWMVEHGSKYDIAEKFVYELKTEMKWDDDTKIDVIWDTKYVFARTK
ncbi:unnamed protein product [Candida verbasci]|uniref:Methyltransferase type 11 domain-containing protein n=1 Tax=Candida verbasci TaxID=1227364 RepID=A0A9W4XA16_9ASCO|nr:unnamed protein product [Candida verbasci]